MTRDFVPVMTSLDPRSGGAEPRGIPAAAAWRDVALGTPWAGGGKGGEGGWAPSRGVGVTVTPLLLGPPSAGRQAGAEEPGAT